MVGKPGASWAFSFDVPTLSSDCARNLLPLIPISHLKTVKVPISERGCVFAVCSEVEIDSEKLRSHFLGCRRFGGAIS
jgi:hypothetical protein